MPRRPRSNLTGFPLHIIELNPVRARMVEHPAAYLWSSYRHAMGERNEILHDHPLYKARDTDGKRRCYAALFRTELDAETIDRYR